MSITVTPFGKTAQGEQVDRITLRNARGENISVISYGAHLQSVQVLDREGKLGEVCLGLDSVAQYEARNNGHMGGTIGRYANRIAGAQFELHGETYKLFANNGPNTLHGGRDGFDKHLWRYELDGDSLLMRRLSPHMEEGFPGALEVAVRFRFDDQARLRIDYEAVSDQDTQVNLTNHAYFNLGPNPDIRNHLLQIHANHVIAADKTLIPTGEFSSVEGTPYDVREPVLISEVLKRTDNAMFSAAQGFDIGYVPVGEGMREMAVLRSPETGRCLRAMSDLPGVQCYSGQYMNCRRNELTHYGAYAGLALETQYHPDTLHHPAFGDTLLKAGQVFRTSTVYAFSVE